MFEIRPLDPDTYRRQTRRSTLIIAVLFLVLAMLLSTLTVQLLGQPGGDNFWLNVGGVAVALLIVATLVRQVFWSQPWMASAVYGWQLKRNLMRITNVMHQVKAQVVFHDPQAMRLLRFYHLGLSQMHSLDGNSSDHSELIREMDQHKAQMEAQGLSVDQPRLEPQWLERMKSQKV